MTLRTGQAMFRSIRSAPAARAARAALRQRRRLGGEELKADGVLVGAAGQVGRGAPVVVHDAVRRDHLGEHEAGARSAAPSAGRRGVADAGHGRHEQAAVEAQGADRQGLQQRVAQVVRGCDAARRRAVSGLLAAQHELDAAHA